MDDRVELDELRAMAARNRDAFESVLSPYVQCKLDQLQDQRRRGVREDWFDASGCVWCLFDDPAFERCEDRVTKLRSQDPDEFRLQVFWSLGDVVMPEDCDEAWVASRIAREALGQLGGQGYDARAEERLVEGETHQGVAVTQPRTGLRKLLSLLEHHGEA